MGYWLASGRDCVGLPTDWMKRFDPRFWTVNFPRPMMASVVTTAADALRVDCAFYRTSDLAGLIWESEDRHDHALLRYETSRDYRGCRLSFRWRSTGGVLLLDAINGPTLTIEGRDAAGAARSWYVRLWNYAEGTPLDAAVVIDFDALESGFVLPGEAVWAGDIDRMFLSVAPVGFTGVDGVLAARVEGTVFVEDIACEGSGSTLALGDAVVPPHALRIAGGYDDSYHLTPARVLRNIVALGYRERLNHYVGMSHYFELAWDGTRFTASGGINAPCRAWHVDLAARAAELGIGLILSLSYELLDMHAPEAWKQRAHDGAPALTGWEPPSTLLSPANTDAMAFLEDVLLAFAGIAAAAGQDVRVQIGEPWWWTGFGEDRTPCFYDTAAVAAYVAETGQPAPAPMTDVREAVSAAQGLYLDWLGEVLGRSTLALRDAAKAEFPGAEVCLLFYAPQVLDAAAPNLERVNMPAAWVRPAFDVLQLEDYDFVTREDASGSRRAVAAVTGQLGYPAAEQHYFGGFVARPEDAGQWQAIGEAVQRAMARGVGEVFVWALPQVMRDGFTYFAGGEDGVETFHDVRFPIEVGMGASGGPEFSTTVVTAASGFEQRNSDWAEARMRFDAGLGVRSEADLAEVVAFFRARRGAAVGFRFRDPADHSSADGNGVPGPADQVLGTADGVRTRFELVKRYGTGAEAQVRRVTRPEIGSVRVAVGGVERSSDWIMGDGGAVEFDTAPAAGAVVTAGFRYDVPVRFGEDRLEVSTAAFAAGEIPSIPLVEVREA